MANIPFLNNVTLSGSLTGTTAAFSGNVIIGTGVVNASIGGDISITQGSIGLRINDTASAISPTTATSNNDNVVDLGVSNIRFRNLYMGGTGTFGGALSGTTATFSGNVTISTSGHSYLNIDAANSSAYEAGILFKIGGTTKWETYTAANDGNYNIYSQGQGIKLAIAPLGNVGIGETTPLAKLHVKDGGGADGILIDSSSPNLYMQTAAAKVNWRVSAQENTDGGFEIGSSTTASGNAITGTYNQLFTIINTGVISFNTYTAGLLKVGANGVVSSATSGADLPGGPYLPLSGGTLTNTNAYPLKINRGLDVNVYGANGAIVGIGSLDGTTYKPGAEISGNLLANGDDGAFMISTRKTNVMTNAVTINSNQEVSLAGSLTGTSATFSGNVTAQGISSSFNTGNSGTFITNDSNSYPRITLASASAQLGLFRSGTAVGGMYIGADSNGFRLMNASFSSQFTVSQSGNGVFTGSLTGTSASFSGTGTFSGNIRSTNTSDNSYYSLLGNNGSLTLNTAGVNSGIQFQTLNDTKMTILNGGNVGIGTDNPQQILHVSNPSGNFGDEAVIRGSTSAGDPKGEIAFKRAASGDGANLILRSSNSSGTIQDAITIDTSQNVGIGTDDPSSKLSIDTTTQDVLSLNSTDGDGPYAVFRKSDASLGFIGNANALSNSGNGNFGVRANADLVFSAGGSTERMRIDSDGIVTVGNRGSDLVYSPTSYQNDLIIERKNNDGVNQLATLRFNVTGYTGQTTGEASIGAVQTSNASSADIVFGTRHIGTRGERMRITSDGNVGIGITDPSAKLEVKENFWIAHPNAEEITFRVDNYGATGTDAGTLLRMYNQSGTTTINIDARGGSTRDTYFNGGGDFGIGIAAPVSKLHVYQTNTDENTASGVTIEQDGTGDATLSFLLSGLRRWKMGIDNSDSDKFKISSSINLGTDTKLTIDTSGNVGIGTDDPTSKLHVFGGSADTELKVTSNDNYISRIGLYEEKAGVLHGGFMQYKGNDGDKLQLGTMNSGTDTVHLSFNDISSAATFSSSVTATTLNLTTVGSAASPSLIFGGDGDTGIYKPISNTLGFSTFGIERLSISSTGAATFSSSITAAGDITAFSDERLKSDIKTITNALDKVNALRGVTFEKDGVRGLGVIAQEVEKVIPEVVKDNEEYKSVAYGNIVGVLIEAIKELKAEVDELKSRL